MWVGIIKQKLTPVKEGEEITPTNGGWVEDREERREMRPMCVPSQWK